MTNKPHPGVKHDTLVNAGALQMALNVLRRAGKDEVADELEKTAQQSFLARQYSRSSIIRSNVKPLPLGGGCK